MSLSISCASFNSSGGCSGGWTVSGTLSLDPVAVNWEGLATPGASVMAQSFMIGFGTVISFWVLGWLFGLVVDFVRTIGRV